MDYAKHIASLKDMEGDALANLHDRASSQAEYSATCKAWEEALEAATALMQAPVLSDTAFARHCMLLAKERAPAMGAQWSKLRDLLFDFGREMRARGYAEAEDDVRWIKAPLTAEEQAAVDAAEKE